MAAEDGKGGMDRYRWAIEVLGGVATILIGVGFVMEAKSAELESWLVVGAGVLVLLIGVAGGLSRRST